MDFFFFCICLFILGQSEFLRLKDSLFQSWTVGFGLLYILSVRCAGCRDSGMYYPSLFFMVSDVSRIRVWPYNIFSIVRTLSKGVIDSI